VSSHRSPDLIAGRSMAGGSGRASGRQGRWWALAVLVALTFGVFSGC
jgi:hypothetical protein